MKNQMVNAPSVSKRIARSFLNRERGTRDALEVIETGLAGRAEHVPSDSGSGLRFVASSCVFHPRGDVAPVL